jgi:hypothetical protein
MNEERNEYDFKGKINEAKTKFVNWSRKAKQDVICFCYNNKEFVMVAVPAVAGVAFKSIRFAAKRSNLRKQENIKNLYCYDNRLGHYWALRRELTNDEWLKIDQRKRNGERLGDILWEMKVLK